MRLPLESFLLKSSGPQTLRHEPVPRHFSTDLGGGDSASHAHNKTVLKKRKGLFLQCDPVPNDPRTGGWGPL